MPRPVFLPQTAAPHLNRKFARAVAAPSQTEAPTRTVADGVRCWRVA